MGSEKRGVSPRPGQCGRRADGATEAREAQGHRAEGEGKKEKLDLSREYRDWHGRWSRQEDQAAKHKDPAKA